MKKYYNKVLRWGIIIFVAVGSIYINTFVIAKLTRQQGESFINAVSEMILYGGVCLFFILILSVKWSGERQCDNPSEKKTHLLTFLFATTMVGLVFIAVISFVVDPRDKNGMNIFPSRVNPARTEKLKYYEQLVEPPKLIIMGSSTAFTLSPQYIDEKFGISSFNFALNAGEPLESAVFLEYFGHTEKELPEVILLQVKENRSEREGYSQLPAKLLHYLEFRPFVNEVSSRLSNLLSIQQFSESIYVFYRVAIKGNVSLHQYVYLEDGSMANQNLEFSEDAMLRHLDKLPVCSVIPEYLVIGLDKIVDQANESNSSIVLYISPYYPEFYDHYLVEHDEFQLCNRLIIDYLTSLADENENVFFEDYTMVKDMNGLEGRDGFTDATHLTPENAEKLVDALSETLMEAYNVAQQMREKVESVE